MYASRGSDCSVVHWTHRSTATADAVFVLVPLVASKFDVCVRLFIEGSLVHNDTDSKPCDCVNECEMTTFSSAISTSQMSTTTALSDILDTLDAFLHLKHILSGHLRLENCHNGHMGWVLR